MSTSTDQELVASLFEDGQSYFSNKSATIELSNGVKYTSTANETTIELILEELAARIQQIADFSRQRFVFPDDTVIVLDDEEDSWDFEGKEAFSFETE